MAKRKKKEPIQAVDTQITVPARVVRLIKQIDSKKTVEELAISLLEEQAKLYSRLYSDSKSDSNIQFSLPKSLCKELYEEGCDEAQLKRTILSLIQREIHFKKFTLPRLNDKVGGWKKK